MFVKKTINLDDIFQNYFKKSLIEDVICENCSLVDSEKKATLAVWRNLKEPPSVLDIQLQRGRYDIEKYWVIKDECKVAIPSEYFIKKPSSNENISYTSVTYHSYW